VKWLVLLLAAVSLPGLLLGSICTRERTVVVTATRESFFSAIKCMLTNIHFLRVTSIYAILLLIFGLFGAFQSYLVIYYVCGGNLKEGAMLQGYGGTLGAVIGIACIPVMGWLSRRIQKHHALNVAVAIMLCGTFSAYWLYTPAHPWLSIVDMAIYQFGVASIFTIIPSLHADVVDFDEYKTGRRREGMLGAAASYLMKSAMALGAGVSGFLINWTGFEVAKGGDQGDGTFLALRLTYIIGASAPLLLVMLILWRYPLTEEKVNEVQRALLERKKGLSSLSGAD
jgi:GPH family glycoside/pentoside/hexuronide:cation symporter